MVIKNPPDQKHTPLAVHIRTGLRWLLRLLLLICISPTWAASGIIQSVTGTARVSQPSGLERAAQKDVQLYPGDTITTGAKSEVRIRMIDEAMIWIQPESSLTIDKYSYVKQGDAKDQAVMRLIAGGFRTVTGLIGKINRNNYSLSTPNAVMGIRGTDFQVMFVSPGQTRTPSSPESGTYNHVYLGSTVLNANGNSVNVEQGQTAFAGLTPGAPPQLLRSKPAFMDAQQAANKETVPAAKSEAKPRMLLVTLRFGSPPSASSTTTTSSRDARSTNEEQTVRVMDGAKAIMTISQNAPSATRQGNGTQQGTIVELSPKLAGNNVTLQLQAQRSSSSPSGNLAQNVATTISVPLSEWTEVTGSGPFTSNNTVETTSSRSAQSSPKTIYLKVDEVTQ